MSQAIQKHNYILFKALAISVLGVWASFLWQGHKGFNLWDEGYLWYGVQRVLAGEVPIRDFMSYDPGRYYWSAALASVFGDDGIMSVRAAVAVFQVLGLFAGLLLVAQSTKTKEKSDIVFWLIAAATLIVWMFPRHKLFDISISIFQIGVLAYLVSNPIAKRYVIAGACVGLIAVFGRNHGVYGAVGSLGVIAWLSIRQRSGPALLHAVLLWAGGVVIGFSPIALMALLVPGFAAAFLSSVLFIFEFGGTNLPLPVPWPWKANFTAVPLFETVRGVLTGLFFIGTLVFAALSILWVVYRKLDGKPVQPALVASAFLAIPYAHYAFSRADVGHLAQGIFPLLVGCLVILSVAGGRVKWPLAAILCVASFWVMHVFHPGWQCMASRQCVGVEIAGKTVQMEPGTANEIAMLRQLAEQFAPNGQSFIATPFWPGAYALLQRKSPIWETYALFPRTEAFENKEIERIKAAAPGFAFILDLPLDGRDELRYKNTHPLIHQYILDNFDPVAISQNPAYQVYKARSVGQ